LPLLYTFFSIARAINWKSAPPPAHKRVPGVAKISSCPISGSRLAHHANPLKIIATHPVDPHLFASSAKVRMAVGRETAYPPQRHGTISLKRFASSKAWMFSAGRRRSLSACAHCEQAMGVILRRVQQDHKTTPSDAAAPRQPMPLEVCYQQQRLPARHHPRQYRILRRNYHPVGWSYHTSGM